MTKLERFAALSRNLRTISSGTEKVREMSTLIAEVERAEAEIAVARRSRA